MIKNLGELKASGYASKSIKDELRDNLIKHMQAGTTVLKAFTVLKIPLFLN